ncbi:MAG: PKD domain-containing protein [Solirubrobacterales bacterium]
MRAAATSIGGRLRGALALAALALLLGLAPAAGAREALVANSGDGSVSVIELGTGSTVATIGVGNGPSDVAIAPDGSRAYVTNEADGTVSAIDVGARSVLGAPIAVGSEPRGIAIAPGGGRAYVANRGSDSVSVIDLGRGAVVATIPLAAESEPEGLAVSPDGASVFVAQRGGDIAILSTATNAAIGAIETSAGLGPARLSLVPDGSRGFLTNSNSSSVSVFNTATRLIHGSPLLVGTNPAGIAVNPAGPRTYAAAQSADTVVAIETDSHRVVGSPVPGFEAPAGIAIAPDGANAYVADEGSSTVTILDTRANAGVGKIGVGSAPRGIAILPDQGPVASFLPFQAPAVAPAAPGLPTVNAEQPVLFDASASRDRDGRVASYAWEFGDGQAETSLSPQTEHVYAAPGTYFAALKVSDEEGCSTARVFTGQTVSCNGSGAAFATVAIHVRDATPPAFRLFAKRRQPLRRFVVAIASCPQESCRAQARGYVRSAFRAGKRKEVRAKGRTRLGRRALVNGIPRRIKLRLSGRAFRAARRALARRGAARVRVVAVGRDAAGNRQVRKATVRLFKRQAAKKRGGRRR